MRKYFKTQTPTNVWMKIEVLEALTLRMCVAEDYGSGGVGPTDALLEAWTFIRGVEPSLTITAQTAHTMTGCYQLDRSITHTYRAVCQRHGSFFLL